MRRITPTPTEFIAHTVPIAHIIVLALIFADCPIHMESRIAPLTYSLRGPVKEAPFWNRVSGHLSSLNFSCRLLEPRFPHPTTVLFKPLVGKAAPWAFPPAATATHTLCCSIHGQNISCILCQNLL